MEYNTKREKMMFYDYGRNIYKMIEYAKNIQDREERTIAAKNIVKAMAIVNPLAKECDDYEHKLWDHLMMWSNFELDVDCPYPIENTTEIKFKPRKLHYFPNKIRYRHYGKLMEDMVKKAVSMPDGPEKDSMVALIVNQMYKDHIDYNHTQAPLDILNKQLMDLSDGKLQLPENIQLADYVPETPVKYNGNNKRKLQKKRRKR